MNILVLEDRGSVAFYMNEALTDLGHTVFDAYSIIDARSYLESERIDCIIADLNMSPDGLTPSEVEETKDGLLSGWIWLRNYVYKRQPSLRDRTIILSEYTYALDNVPPEERKGIRVIAKKGSTSSAGEVLRSIKTIFRILERESQEKTASSS